MDGIQINPLDGAGIDLVRLVMVEQHRRLQVLVPRNHFIIRHLCRRLRGAEAVKTVAIISSARLGICQEQSRQAYFDISRVDTVIPLHNKTISPVRATATRNRVRVKNINIAFHGGNLALADFQVTPPLGRSIADGI